MLLGKIGGVRIKINLFLGLLAGIYIYLGLGWEVLLIFTAVLVHEIAHVMVAFILGIKIAEVELFPFGGQAKIEDFTGLEPDLEIYMAMAGPAVSLSLAGIFYFLQDSIISAYLPLFININLLLGLFNLCPALPMDGGRILRAVLSGFIGYKKATAGCALLGKIIALGLVGWGGYLFYSGQNGLNFMLAGVLVFWAANREGKLLAYAFMRYLVNKKSDLAKHGFMPTQQLVSREDTYLKDIMDSTKPTFYMIVVVVNEGEHLTGMYSEAELIECFLEKGPGARLRDV